MGVIISTQSSSHWGHFWGKICIIHAVFDRKRKDDGFVFQFWGCLSIISFQVHLAVYLDTPTQIVDLHRNVMTCHSGFLSSWGAVFPKELVVFTCIIIVTLNLSMKKHIIKSIQVTVIRKLPFITKAGAQTYFSPQVLFVWHLNLSCFLRSSQNRHCP